MKHTLIGFGSGDNILKPSTDQVRLLLQSRGLLCEKAKHIQQKGTTGRLLF